MSKIPHDRIVNLHFEADDEFMAEIKVIKQDYISACSEHDRRYQEAVDRFRARLFPKKEAVN